MSDEREGSRKRSEGYAIRRELMALETMAPEAIDEEEFATCLRVLRAMMGVRREEDERRVRLDEMCALYYRSSRKERVKARKQARKQRDGELSAQTGIRERDEERWEARRQGVMPGEEEARRSVGELEQPRSCYHCKEGYQQVHFFYDRLCPRCAPWHWERRHQRTALQGRRVVLTGGRIKIGFELGLKLLRDGAEVIVTTRFPRDAARRYAAVEDFEQWADRLHLYGVELRDVVSVERFCDAIASRFGHLDMIINNAAQTVRRPDSYYAEELALERAPWEELSDREQRVMGRLMGGRGAPSQEVLATQHEEVLRLFGEQVTREQALFPQGERDEDGLQLDLRQHNSWMMSLEEVSAAELLEVQLVNAVAPFLLNARLKPLLMRSPHPDRYIVNVTAKEGQFEVNYKSWRHPHTNMAKAGLNMLTRTSAEDYAREGIYMTSVDTGWVTYEQPRHIKQEWFDAHKGPPLDVIDGAARVYDPIVRGVRDQEYARGVLYVNYLEAPW